MRGARGRQGGQLPRHPPGGVAVALVPQRHPAACLSNPTRLPPWPLTHPPMWSPEQSDFPSRMTISPFWSVRHENAIYFRRSIHNQHVVAAFLSPESPANPARALFTSATEFVFTQPVSKDTQPFTLQSADGTVTKWTDISHSALFQRVAVSSPSRSALPFAPSCPSASLCLGLPAASPLPPCRKMARSH